MALKILTSHSIKSAPLGRKRRKRNGFVVFKAEIVTYRYILMEKGDSTASNG